MLESLNKHELHPRNLTAGTQQLVVWVDVSPFPKGVFSGSMFVFAGASSSLFSSSYSTFLPTMPSKDLRLEHERVQKKYIAMTKALIESVDVDGFRPLVL